MVATSIIGAGILGAGASIFGSTSQANSARQGIAAETNMFNTAQAGQQPFISAGQSAIPSLEALLGTGPAGTPSPTDMLKNVPGFNFISSLAQQGVSNQGTTTGLGGNTLLAGANAGTQVALNSAWNPIVNSLQALMQTGASTAGNVGQQAVQTGANIAGSTMNVGNAVAGGATGAAGSVGNAFTTNALIRSGLLGNNSMYGNASNTLANQNSMATGVPANFLNNAF
jgi:hypothetical protein